MSLCRCLVIARLLAFLQTTPSNIPPMPLLPTEFLNFLSLCLKNISFFHMCGRDGRGRWAAKKRKTRLYHCRPYIHHLKKETAARQPTDGLYELRHCDGKTENVADALTKPKSPLSKDLLQTVVNSSIKMPWAEWHEIFFYLLLSLSSFFVLLRFYMVKCGCGIGVACWIREFSILIKVYRPTYWLGKSAYYQWVTTTA